MCSSIIEKQAAHVNLQKTREKFLGRVTETICIQGETLHLFIESIQILLVFIN